MAKSCGKSKGRPFGFLSSEEFRQSNPTSLKKSARFFTKITITGKNSSTKSATGFTTAGFARRRTNGSESAFLERAGKLEDLAFYSRLQNLASCSIAALMLLHK